MTAQSHPRVSSSVNGIFLSIRKCVVLIDVFSAVSSLFRRIYCVIGKRALSMWWDTIRACDTNSELTRLYQQQKHMIKACGCMFSHFRSYLHRVGLHLPGTRTHTKRIAYSWISCDTQRVISSCVA